MTDLLHITIPLVPPSVNHYKMRTRRGVTFVSDEAKAFKAAVAVFVGGRSVPATRDQKYALAAIVYFGKGQPEQPFDTPEWERHWPQKIRTDFVDQFEKFADWAEQSGGFEIW